MRPAAHFFHVDAGVCDEINLAVEATRKSGIDVREALDLPSSNDKGHVATIRGSDDLDRGVEDADVGMLDGGRCGICRGRGRAGSLREERHAV